MPADRPPPSECAQCGAAIPRGARACPACGADERTGWREASLYDGLDLPDEAWRDDDEPDDSGASRPSAEDRRVNGIAWYWWCSGVIVLLLFGLVALSLI